MRVGFDKLDYFNDNAKKRLSNDMLMGRIIKYIEANPDFKKEVFA